MITINANVVNRSVKTLAELGSQDPPSFSHIHLTSKSVSESERTLMRVQRQTIISHVPREQFSLGSLQDTRLEPNELGGEVFISRMSLLGSFKGLWI